MRGTGGGARDCSRSDRAPRPASRMCGGEGSEDDAGHLQATPDHRFEESGWFGEDSTTMRRGDPERAWRCNSIAFGILTRRIRREEKRIYYNGLGKCVIFVSGSRRTDGSPGSRC